MRAPTTQQAGDAERAAEAVLIQGLRQGDSRSCEQLVRQYATQLLRVTRRYLHAEADARDVLQETFLSIFKAIGQLSGETSLYPWMRRIAINAALMRLRSQRRQPETSIEDLLPRFQADGHQIADTEPWRPSAETELSNRRTRGQVRAAIERLPESHRVVLLLRDIEELDTEETARILNLSEGAVKVRLHRARQALRALLEPLFVHSSGEHLALACDAAEGSERR